MELQLLFIPSAKVVGAIQRELCAVVKELLYPPLTYYLGAAKLDPAPRNPSSAYA
jgi:hypothetical protein